MASNPFRPGTPEPDERPAAPPAPAAPTPPAAPATPATPAPAPRAPSAPPAPADSLPPTVTVGARSADEPPALHPASTHDLQRIVEGRHHDPHSILGPHPYDGAVTVRVLRPWAEQVTVVARTPTGETRVDLEHEHGGVFVGAVPVADVPDYRIEVGYGGSTQVVDDPYRFLPTLGDVDLHLIAEGRH